MRKKAYTFILLIFMTLSGFSQAERHKILVLHSRSADFPWVTAINKAFESIREENFPNVRFYFEFMNKNFPEDRLGNDVWKSYLAGKYSELNLSFIIAEGTEAVHLLKQNIDLFPKVPKIHRGGDLVKNTWAGNSLYLTSNIATAAVRTILLAREQNPELKTIFLINGGTQATTPVIPAVKQFLESYTEIRLVVISDFSLEELLDTVSGINNESIILYTLVMRDTTGTTFIPRDVLEEITQNSPVTVYTFWDSLLGAGTVGGTMLSANRVAREMYQAGIDYLNHGSYKQDYDTMATIWDWQVLKRYGLKPPGEKGEYSIINKPDSFFKTYTWELVILVITVLVLFSAVISVALIKYHMVSLILRGKKAELEELIDYQTLLIREIDHRVKNNLAILKSMVSLQIHESDNQEVKDNLHEISNRITSIKNIHDDLYKAEGINEINALKYFTELLTQIQESMLKDTSGIMINMDIAEVQLKPRDAMHIGLMVNELVTNALKYAFPAGIANGNINVTFTKEANEDFLLEVTDNGKGLPTAFDIETGKGLGLKIVEQLTRELKGDLKIYSDQGTRFSLMLDLS